MVPPSAILRSHIELESITISYLNLRNVARTGFLHFREALSKIILFTDISGAESASVISQILTTATARLQSIRLISLKTNIALEAWLNAALSWLSAAQPHLTCMQNFRGCSAL